MCETIGVNDQSKGGDVELGQLSGAEVKTGEISKLEKSKALLLQLNLRYNNYATEARSLIKKLSRQPALAAITLPEYRGEQGAEKLKALLPACPTEAARRRLFRLILLEGRLMPIVSRQIYDLDIEVS